MNIEEYTSELRALFVSILDVKTGDLDSLIQALEGLNKRLKKLENETHNRED
jgi:hypothetical protein